MSRLRLYDDNRVRSLRALIYDETRIQIPGFATGDFHVLWVTAFRLATSSESLKSVLTARIDAMPTDNEAHSPASPNVEHGGCNLRTILRQALTQRRHTAVQHCPD